MKRMTIMAVLALLVAVPGSAGAGGGTGNYEWSLSTSNTDPNENLSPVDAPTSLYLWYVGACGTEAGMSAAEMKINLHSGWTGFAFVPTAPFLNFATYPDVALGVPGCPDGGGGVSPILAGTIFMAGSGGAAGLAPSVGNGLAVTLNCDPNPVMFHWAADVRLRGAAAPSYAGTIQDHGNGCTADAVEGSSWGSIKSLYR